MSDLTAKIPEGNVPGPQVLQGYREIHPDLPAIVMQEWSFRNRRAFIYATIALIIGGLVALSLIGGFIYLVMQGHGGYGSALLGAGALGIVAGFLKSRLDH